MTFSVSARWAVDAEAAAAFGTSWTLRCKVHSGGAGAKGQRNLRLAVRVWAVGAVCHPQIRRQEPYNREGEAMGLTNRSSPSGSSVRTIVVKGTMQQWDPGGSESVPDPMKPALGAATFTPTCWIGPAMAGVRTNSADSPGRPLLSLTAFACLQLLAASQAQPPRLGAALRAGMTLTYTSDGPAQPPWTIDSVTHGVSGPPGAECAAVSIRRDPAAAPTPAERYCLAQDTLYRWSDRTSRWEISRPVGPSMHWSTTRGNGDTVHYVTAAISREVIGSVSFDVVHTTVTTVDSLGRPKARLRERYAIALLTATGGAFESPDPTANDGWVRRRTFSLSAVAAPPG